MCFSKKVILKWMHYPLGLIPACFSKMGKLSSEDQMFMSRDVKFNSSCVYDLEDEDQYDWNKLFGVCFGITGIHKNSVRWGWRYNLDTDKIDVCAIIYNNGTVKREKLGDVCVGEFNTFNITIKYEGNDIKAIFQSEEIYKEYTLVNLSSYRYWGSGFYFGGNRRAPHTMSAIIK